MHKSLIRRWIDLIPSVCEVCGQWPSKAICQTCIDRWTGFRSRCECCAVPVQEHVRVCGACLTSTNQDRIARCVAAVDYGYPWDRLVARLKFQNTPGWASVLASVMHHAPFAKELIEASDGLVPIPLAPGRLAERGYNQARLLGRELQRHHVTSGGRKILLMEGLQRRQETVTQHALGRSQRWRNLKAAFSLAPDEAVAIRGKRLLLVDDVSTTGATLQAAARVLLNGGARQVNAIVLCRTPPEQHLRP